MITFVVLDTRTTMFEPRIYPMNSTMTLLDSRLSNRNYKYFDMTIVGVLLGCSFTVPLFEA